MTLDEIPADYLADVKVCARDARRNLYVVRYAGEYVSTIHRPFFNYATVTPTGAVHCYREED